MDLAEQVFAAGVVGAGGAGFPTHLKLVDGARLLVVNGAECEPLLASDRYFMRHHADEIVAGIQAVAAAHAIPRVVIGLKAKYADEIAALQAAITAAGAAIELHGTEAFYPAGDEQVLIYEITGQTVPPGGIPLALGIVVINVTTALEIHRAQQGEPVLRRLVTVTGEVRAPALVDAPVGTTPADLIAAAGGAGVASYAFIRGGPLMGQQYHMDAASSFGFTKADAGLIVLPAGHPLIEFSAKPIQHILNETRSACIQCTLCTELCPRFLIGHQMRPHRVMRSVQSGGSETDLLDALLCCECGICELYACPMGLSPRRMNVHVKGLLRAKGVTQADPHIYPGYTADREYRRIAQSRFVERWQLGRYPTHLDQVVPCEPASVMIPTKHGVGRPSRPVVAVGDQVQAGQVVASVDAGEVGSLVHASIGGRVTTVTADFITIGRTGA